MMNAIYLQRLRNAEYLQFLNYVIAILEDNDPAALKVIPQVHELQTQHAACEALFKLPQGSNLTDALVAADAKRDDILTGISQLISGYKNHFDQGHKDAAVLLEQSINLYGPTIYRLNYQAESSTIKSLVGDWDNDPKLTDAITLLGLNDWKTELTKSNDQFMAVYSQRTQELGGKPSDTLLVQRTQANTAYYNLVRFLEAHHTLDTTKAYAKVFGEINALIDQYTTLLERRSKDDDAA